MVFNKDIKNISKHEINLMTGFLMETKQNYSLIDHMNICDKISIPIIYILLNKSKNVSDNYEFYLNIQEMGDEILDNNEKEEEIKELNNENNEINKDKKIEEADIYSDENNKINDEENDLKKRDDKSIKKLISNKNHNINTNVLIKIIKEKNKK